MMLPPMMVMDTLVAFHDGDGHSEVNIETEISVFTTFSQDLREAIVSLEARYRPW